MNRSKRKLRVSLRRRQAGGEDRERGRFMNSHLYSHQPAPLGSLAPSVALPQLE